MFMIEATFAKTELSFKSVKASQLRKLEVSYAKHLERLEEEALPPNLYGDQIRLKQVLINLVKNALKHTKGGHLTIFAGYSRSLQQLIVHVVDTGRGIHRN